MPSVEQSSNSPRISLFRLTLPGEYAAMLLTANAAFAIVAWSIDLHHRPSSALMVLAGLWIIARCTVHATGGVCAGGITATFFGLLVVAGQGDPGQLPPWLSWGPVSQMGFVVIIGLLLILEVVEWSLNRRQRKSAT